MKNNIEKIRQATCFIFIFIILFQPWAFAFGSESYYSNKEFGFSISAPEGWIRHESGQYDALVEFSKPGEKTFMFGVTVDNISRAPDIKTAVDFSRRVNQFYQQNPNIVVYEPPQEVLINQLPVGKIVFGTKGAALKTVFYEFLNGENIITVYALYQDPDQLIDMPAILESLQLVEGNYGFEKLARLKTVSTFFEPIGEQDYAELKEKIVQKMKLVRSCQTRYIIEEPANKKLSSDNFKAAEWSFAASGASYFEIEQILYPSKTKTIWRVVGRKIYWNEGSWSVPVGIPDDTSESQSPEISQLASKRDFRRFLGIGKYLKFLTDEKAVGYFRDRDSGYIALNFEPKNVDALLFDMIKIKPTRSRVLFWIDERDYAIRLVRIVFEGKDANGKTIKQKHEHYLRAFGDVFHLENIESSK